LPAPQEKLVYVAPITEERLTSSEGEAIESTEREGVADVVVGRSDLRIQVIWILRAEAGIAAEVEGRGPVINIVAVSVGCKKAEIL
jgi:hypothetical protein